MTDWLADPGLVTPQGVEIDASARTSAPGVCAVGDVACLSIKVIGLLPRSGAPSVLEDAGAGHGVFAWDGPTVVALGVRRAVPKLRAIVRDLGSPTT